MDEDNNAKKESWSNDQKEDILPEEEEEMREEEEKREEEERSKEEERREEGKNQFSIKKTGQEDEGPWLVNLLSGVGSSYFCPMFSFQYFCQIYGS